MGTNDTDWRSIICRGIESDELDYKAAQNWKNLPRAGKAKFVRHCIAMANTKGSAWERTHRGSRPSSPG